MAQILSLSTSNCYKIFTYKAPHVYLNLINVVTVKTIVPIWYILLDHNGRLKMADEKEVMFYTDGRHSSVYMHEPPMYKQQYVEPIDELLDLGIDTITYAVGDCSVLLYDTKVGERWGHNVDLTDHPIWWKAARNVKSMIDRGIDPLMLVCEHAKDKGFQFLPCLLLNLTHTSHGRVTNCRIADFTTDHPEWIVGEEPEYPRAKYDTPGRLSYAVPEVRENRLKVIRELLSDYPSDGIELSMTIGIAPLIARKEVREHTSTLTDWMKQIRDIRDKASQNQGIDKRLALRLSSTIEGNKEMGIDVERWIKDELVDTIMLNNSDSDGFEGQTDILRQFVQLAKGTNVKILAAIEATNNIDLTPAVNYAAASNAYHVGADGVFFHTYYPMTKRYPYNNEAAGRLRFMGHPDVIAFKDKRYRLGIIGDIDKSSEYLNVALERSHLNKMSVQLPLELQPQIKSKDIKIYVADDVKSAMEFSRLWKCELQIMLPNTTETDEIEIFWNGALLPKSTQRLADWVYQLRPRPSYAVDGYRIHFNLIDKYLPKIGENIVNVLIKKRDEQIVDPIRVAEVRIAIDYLPHRNALRDEETYEG